MKLATLCYVKRAGQTLMLHRVKRADDIHHGKWNGLGGKVEPGETPEACAIRELREETGLEVRAPALRGILTFPEFKDGEDWYVFVYLIREFSGVLGECPEGDLAWIDDDKLLDLPLWEGDPLFLKWLAEERFFSGMFHYRQGRLLAHSVVFHDGLSGAAQP